MTPQSNTAALRQRIQRPSLPYAQCVELTSKARVTISKDPGNDIVSPPSFVEKSDPRGVLSGLTTPSRNGHKNPPTSPDSSGFVSKAQIDRLTHSSTPRQGQTTEENPLDPSAQTCPSRSKTLRFTKSLLARPSTSSNAPTARPAAMPRKAPAPSRAY